MPYYRQVGQIPPKRHIQFHDKKGNMLYEELMGEEGFSSDSALVYHRYIPAGIVHAEPWNPGNLTLTPNYPLVPRHLKLHDLFPDQEWKAADVVTSRRLVLGNDDMRISYVAAGQPSPLYRNAIGDECVYIEAGSGTVETMFGPLPFREGHYVIMPSATTHRWVPDSGNPLRAYIIEYNGHISPPKRYLSRFGQLLESAPYCERDLNGPAETLVVDGTDVEVLVKHHGPGGIAGTRYVVPHHPLDVVGWDGCLYPYTLHISDFEPLTGRVHQPPPLHQVFEGPSLIICNFVPRKVDYHPQAIPVPYYHANVDTDEVMFYCGGDYEARKGSGINQGSISLHPSGHQHGPQPGAMERSVGVEYFDELAVMVDTFRPLLLGEGGVAADDGTYVHSWLGGGGA